MQRCSLWNHISIHLGTKADYAHLARFHYRAGPPIAVTRVFVARYTASNTRPMLAGILVETRPVLNCAMRNIATHKRYLHLPKRESAILLNAEITCIARVIVHPVFRSLGIGSALLRHSLNHARTPFVEALAAMGHIQPLFQRAGMTPFLNPRGGPLYYFWERPAALPNTQFEN